MGSVAAVMTCNDCNDYMYGHMIQNVLDYLICYRCLLVRHQSIDRVLIDRSRLSIGSAISSIDPLGLSTGWCYFIDRSTGTIDRSLPFIADKTPHKHIDSYDEAIHQYLVSRLFSAFRLGPFLDFTFFFFFYIYTNFSIHVDYC